MSAASLRVAMAQMNLRVGDIDGNVRRIIEAAEIARDREKADLVVGSELALIGCPPDDLLWRRGLPAAIEEGLNRLIAEVSGITIAIGYPEYAGGVIHNAAVVVRDGEWIAHYRKQGLSSRGLLDDDRYFEPGDKPCVFEQQGYAVGITIGEEPEEEEPVARTAAAGAQIMCNLNASPFHAHKQGEREALLAKRARSNGLTICDINNVGGQDELVFDGGSCVVDATGQLIARASAFAAGVHAIDWSPTAACGDIAELAGIEARVYDALVKATRDYVENNGFPGVLVGASGGIDSALAMAVAADALGGDRVWAVAMPSRYTATISNTDAADQAERMGLHYDEVSIESGFSALLGTLAPLFGDREPDTAEENLQSRIRGALLMSLSNKFGHVVLATGNKSEMAVGYATLYGDMCGGFAPLKDVYKTWVYRLAKFRNTRGEVIPERVITRAPSAELRADQADSDTLPEYDVLDAIIEAYVEAGDSVEDICARGYNRTEVHKSIGLIRRNEYKRNQAAPGPKVTRCAFGRDRRYPITAVYGGL